MVIYSKANFQPMPAAKSLRTCPKGHRYYKSSDCPTCPQCEAEARPHDGFLAAFSAPARRALQSLGIDTPGKLSKYTQKEIMSLHGMGPASLPKMKAALQEKGLDFKKTNSRI
ncbi:RNA polymerase alpha subunit C-terminal domain-containing protein [Chitinophaga sp. NPDC101104]|uniref:RNA polymerase alpha subunit C-terminal domain-containing protein n=1 Tax=Chitinophaga sp. NPDC101104 TaxID=3390561 RepID=UPI003D066AB7